MSMLEKFEKLTKSKDEKINVELTKGQVKVLYWLLKHAEVSNLLNKTSN